MQHDGNQKETVVITGASAGIGRAAALRFARDGARLVLIARGPDGLRAARDDVERLGGQAILVEADVADAQALEHAAEVAEGRFGPIDIWINNAMASLVAPADRISPEEFRRVTDVTYLGQVYGALAALRHMRPHNRGTIVFVASAAASSHGAPLQSAYCGAEHALRGFFDSLRGELQEARIGVHATMVELPALNTPQFDWAKRTMPRRARPAAPIYQPEIAAEGIHWASHQNRRTVRIGLPAGVSAAAGMLSGEGWLKRMQLDGHRRSKSEETVTAGNLWEPLDQNRDYGAHGPFDAEAGSGVLPLWLTTHRFVMISVGLGLAALAATVLMGFRARPAADRSAASEPDWRTPLSKAAIYYGEGTVGEEGVV